MINCNETHSCGSKTTGINKKDINENVRFSKTEPLPLVGYSRLCFDFDPMKCTDCSYICRTFNLGNVKGLKISSGNQLSRFLMLYNL